MPVSQGVETFVILNPAAGAVAARGDELSPAAVTAAFAATGLRPRTLVSAPGQLETVLRDVVARRPAAIFVAGGDGTLNTAAGQLVDTGIPLGVLPAGTLNHFARDLGLPVDWRAAASALCRGAPRAIDVGEVNGRIFINNCSLGLYAEAVRRRDTLRRQHGWQKWRAMALASWTTLLNLRRLRLGVETSGGVTSCRTPFLLVSNNRYTGHVLNGAIRERLDEGRLWLHTTRAHRRFTMLRLALQALRRRLDEVDHLETRAVTTATITNEGHRAPPVAIDGELVPLDLPLRFRIRPLALQVLACSS
jgi:diacylglycerol kinase family enzyme